MVFVMRLRSEASRVRCQAEQGYACQQFLLLDQAKANLRRPLRGLRILEVMALVVSLKKKSEFDSRFEIRAQINIIAR